MAKCPVCYGVVYFDGDVCTGCIGDKQRASYATIENHETNKLLIEKLEKMEDLLEKIVLLLSKK